ncbi:leucine-rich repeat and WD repeat-containing protein 1-like isoform X1 [Frankliniella occidentalis]|uniref:Leucine-rich repeat and WD repeat-containing protein 1-like isoform X1 n=2 Tax=Frankliniella occidentalis TaxID=133901 RepID=A0A6J1RWB3_FRAOC|nr:leucine-rich repeat and WD repeat-containing protein 1-like isoform X1 [Frankliniella occidentalis]
METDSFYSDPRYEYEPVSFLKCHSKIKGDKNDRHSKVWMCAFEPHPDFPEKTTDVIATCGSNSVCVINVKTQNVVAKHYSKQAKEDFYSLSWSSIFIKDDLNKTKKKGNVLAVAGLNCVLHILYPSRQVCCLEQKFKKSSSVSISSVQFHPLSTSILCGAFSSGEVYIWDLGELSLPNYDMKLSHLHTLSLQSEIFNMSFSRHCVCLLAATDNGVAAWSLELKDVNDAKCKIKAWKFNFPTMSGTHHSHDGQLVDSVEPIKNGKIVASKCALYGSIYLWDLEEAIDHCGDRGHTKVQPAHILDYSKTDNYFMSLGSSLLSGLLACGDDLGNIWLYDLKEVFSQSLKKQEQSAVIPWPDVDDKSSQWMVELNEVVINKVVVSYNGSYIVAVTNTNLICVWKKERA